MSVKKKNITHDVGWLTIILFLLLIALYSRLIFIQTVERDHYEKISKQRTMKIDTIYANRGNIYDKDGHLLAITSSKYTVRLDMTTVKKEIFEKNIDALSDSLSVFLGKSPSYYKYYLKNARDKKNRYLFLTKNLEYLDYERIIRFPILNLGQYKGGLIVEQKTKRSRPLGDIALRTIGYSDYRGNVGIEGACIQYLKENNGWRKKQKIAKGQWRPINDKNEKDPIDGKDIITTIDINIQDIVHNALLNQLKKFDADHGCAMVMETQTGEVRAISNLGKSKNNSYFEKRNYIIFETQEPGSTFKIASLLVGLEDKMIDTSNMIDTGNGKMEIYGQKIRDNQKDGYGTISLARAIEVSSNVGIVKSVLKAYKSNPQRFVDGIHALGFGEKIKIPIKGEGQPFIPNPKYVKKGDKHSWNGLSLPWMSWGYGIKITPLQLITFYNAIANNGVMLQPKFVKEIRYQGSTEKTFETVVLNKKIASLENIKKVKAILENVVKRGTAKNCYSPNLPMAGKTGTSQNEYWTNHTEYTASFVGFFPVKNPKYSCIIVINKPDKKKGYYGSNVAAPVFKTIAEKIHLKIFKIEKISLKQRPQFTESKGRSKRLQRESSKKNKMPDVVGMPVMDAVFLLENKGFLVKIQENLSHVKKQSLQKGIIERGQEIILY